MSKSNSKTYFSLLYYFNHHTPERSEPFGVLGVLGKEGGKEVDVLSDMLVSILIIIRIKL